MLTLSALLTIAFACWFWSDSLRARERVLHACRLACQQLGLQLLDQTVALSKLRLGQDPGGRWHFQRWYTFEFSTDGILRYQGRAALLGEVVQYVHLDHPDGSTFSHVEPSRRTPPTSHHVMDRGNTSRKEATKSIIANTYRNNRNNRL